MALYSCFCSSVNSVKQPNSAQQLSKPPNFLPKKQRKHEKSSDQQFRACEMEKKLLNFCKAEPTANLYSKWHLYPTNIHATFIDLWPHKQTLLYLKI